MHEKENILRILEETKNAIKKDDASEIKNLSNQTTNTASLTQDPDNIAVAVIIYSLGKIFERENYRSMKGWSNFYRITINSLDNAIKDIKEGKEKAFRKDFEIIRKAISKISGKLKKYIQEVFAKAKINKASRIYEHGISMEQTAKLLGVTMFDLADYAGKTGISDVPISRTLNVKSRIKLAMDMFE
ncbi:hypothetical protein DRN73_02555 [Candidatus Pacearchaeota archaeon]|nr:MAG: hypothetical protein DRN73_02555 [Candidatus Pacearchaeota archaeon]